mgnify:CR=1 FL=1
MRPLGQKTVGSPPARLRRRPPGEGIVHVAPGQPLEFTGSASRSHQMSTGEREQRQKINGGRACHAPERLNNQWRCEARERRCGLPTVAVQSYAARANGRPCRSSEARTGTSTLRHYRGSFTAKTDAFAISDCAAAPVGIHRSWLSPWLSPTSSRNAEARRTSRDRARTQRAAARTRRPDRPRRLGAGTTHHRAITGLHHAHEVAPLTYDRVTMRFAPCGA